MAAPDVPLWSRPERAARGPAPEHSRSAIAAAAVRIADEEGLAAVTMRKVAAAVGAGQASLYRYVANRDELVALMADAVSAELAFDGVPSSHGWRSDILGIAAQLRLVYRRHPWMFDVLATGLGVNALGPAAVDYLEGALAALSPLTATPARARMEAVALLNGVVGLLARSEAAEGQTSPEVQAATVARLTEVVMQGRHPHLAAAMVQPPGPDTGPGPTFERLVIAVLEGVLGTGPQDSGGPAD